MREPIATVIVPVYNTKETIDRTMQSICAQTQNNIDILIIDDGSDLATRNKCDDWIRKDNRVRCIHKANEGLGLTRNLGIKEAIGKYISFVDSDDYIDNDMIEKMTKCAEEYQADMVSSSFYFGEEPERSTIRKGKYVDNIRQELIPRLFGKRKYDEDDFLNVSANTKLYLKEFLHKNKIMCKSEREYIWEDIIFNFEVLLHAKKVFILDNAFYHYCYNPNSLTRVYDNNKIDRIIFIYNYLSSLINKFSLDNEANERLNFFVMGNIRMCIRQVTKFYKKKDAIIEIRKICDKNEVQKIVKSLDRKALSTIQYLLNTNIKMRNRRIIYYMAFLQNWRSEGLIK